MLYNYEKMPEIIEKLKTITAPYIQVNEAPLNSENNYSIMLTISFQSKESWVNGYLKNSKYSRLHLLNDGTCYCFVGVKFRKTKVKDVNTLINKIQKFINTNI